MRINVVFLSILLLTSLLPIITPLADDPSLLNDKRLTFTSKEDLSKLDIDGIIEVSPLMDYETKTIHVEINYTLATIHKLGLENFYIHIPGTQPSGIPGEPLIPLKVVTLRIPGYVEINRIGFTSGHYVHIKESFPFALTPKPLFWINNLSTWMYRGYLDKNYPGTLLSYTAGYTSDETRVCIKIYPIQYLSDEIIVLTDGILQVEYRSIERNTRNESKDSFVNLIITPPTYYSIAKKLESYHEKQGYPSRVINTTWIYTSYEEAEDPPYYGYKSTQPSCLSRYNYSLAKKIISYLRDVDAHPSLRYITILGSAASVPPSYYYYQLIGYENVMFWVPTDFLYASPDYDLIPNYMVGRIPASNILEASQIVDKVIKWNASTELFKDIVVAGGKPFDTPYDLGEMISIYGVNQGYFKGVPPIKCFYTENAFNNKSLLNALKGGVGLIYHIGHGDGVGWRLEKGGYLGIEDIQNLPPNDSTPIIVSIACNNGIFDADLVNLGIKKSFGEAILLSKAGGIAYIGGSRSNAGSTIFSLDEGKLEILGLTYMASMLNYFLEAYSNNSLTSLGELTSHAIER